MGLNGSDQSNFILPRLLLISEPRDQAPKKPKIREEKRSDANKVK